MGLLANLRRFGRKIGGVRTLYQFYLDHDKHIPEGIVIKDKKGREHITGRLEVVCKEEVGIQIHSIEDQDDTQCIPLVAEELEKYTVLPDN